MFRAFRSRTTHRHTHNLMRSRLALEPLECRLAPATCVVGTRSDAPFHTGLSLRDCINVANTDPQSQIKFAPGLNGTITLQQGDLDLKTSMTIDANANGNNIAVSGRGLSRVFNISTSPSTPSHVTFIGFTTKDGRVNGNGGCIYVDNPASSLVLDDMVVTLCKAIGGSGGGVFNEGLTTLYSSTLENNTADLDGGGAWSGRNLSLYNESFVTDNRGRDGGGLYLARTGTTLTIWNDSVVKFNFATRDGGGAWARFNVDVKNCDNANNCINNNTATGSGGGIYSEDGNVTIRDASQVTSNVAINGNGGGIWADYLVTVKDFSAVLQNYTNGSGGGIFSDSGIVRLLNNSGVHNNTSNGGASGGGIWAYYDVFVESLSNVIQNSSAGNGGGIYSAAGSVTIDRGEVDSNVALDNGGGIWAFGNVIVNEGRIGGISNSAGLDGGGIYTANGNFYVQGNSIIEGNTAGGDGGGIWGRVHGVVENSTVRDNIANDDGGGIFMQNFQSLWIDLSTFILNEAGDEGGGVYVENSESVTIIDSTFDQNVASINGGGLAARKIENIAITGSTFSSNRAASGRGGGIDARTGNLYIVNSTFGGTAANPQSAAVAGGGIYVLDELTTINHTTFNDNISYGGPKTGSAIFSDTGSSVYLHNTMVNDTNEISSAIATELLSKGGGGAFFSMGHNLVHDQSFINVTDFDDDIGDIAFGVQALGPLANNGGPTDTYLPLAGGQAIDGGDNSGPIVDQRGFPRSVTGPSDIGSVEVP